LRGSGRRDIADLQRTLYTFRSTLLEHRSEDSLPHAVTLLDLGNALFDLGQRTGNTKNLEEAIVAYQSVLRTNQPHLLNRAPIMARLGHFLQTLGRISSAAGPIKEATQMYRLALREFQVQGANRESTAALNGLGVALFDLWSLDRNPSELREATRVFREATKIYDVTEALSEGAPMEWAIAQFNLGITLINLSTFETDPDDRRRGLQEIDRAIEFFRGNLRKEVAAGYYLALATEIRESVTQQ
jgi:tetratricopeptide (TPR) repeat protein